jgi:DMSO/TMAO reductase YedYZ molybdopterin-dependent catalytic subunit
MARAAVTIRFLSRREALAGAAASLAACDVLDLPPEQAVAPGEALDPITTNAAFYVTSCCGTPAVDRDTWTLRIRGDTTATIDMAYLEGLPARDKEHTLQCIGASPTNPAIGNAVWSGLPLAEILADLGVAVPASAVELKISGADGYETSIPVGDLDAPVWLVWRMNGEPLPDEHGTTARMLTPGRYGTKNPKWIVALELVDEPFTGFWETYGWSNEATYRANGMVAAPSDGAELPAGPMRVVGTAFAGRDPVARVEVSADGGETWADAELTYRNGPDVWTLWAWDWDPAPGTYLVRVRVTTESGETDSGLPEGSGARDGYDGGMQVLVTVV